MIEMKKTTIYYNKKEKLKDPILLVGLPGIGNVGSLVGEHIKNETKAEKFGTLYSPYFPHQAIMLKNGGLRLISNRFYHFKNKKGRSILVLIGDTQAGTPKGQYEVNEKIVRFFKSLGGRTVYTIGGYSAANQYIHNPRVFGVATNSKLRDALGKYGIIFGQANGAVWGAAGIIPAFARKHRMDGACIMGETGMLEIDANAAKSVLEIMKKLLDIDINLGNLDKIKQETEKIIKDMEEASRAANEGPTGGHKENLSYIR
jgi:uncharacterized protein (TIGR00162 family)